MGIQDGNYTLLFIFSLNIFLTLLELLHLRFGDLFIQAEYIYKKKIKWRRKSKKRKYKFLTTLSTIKFAS